MTARLFHISDLHFGRREVPELFERLRDLGGRLTPELLLVTGDVGHRGRRQELERARESLESVGIPLLAVPGNHDIPYTFPARFTRPYSEWERVFGTAEPTHMSERLAIVGLNSVRPLAHQGGKLEDAQLERLATRLRDAQEGALRIVALHHHLATPPWRAARKRPLQHRDHVLRSLARLGVELVASGHVHQASIAERREFEIVEDGAPRTMVLATVAGFSRPRPQRTGEALGLNVYEADAGALTVLTYVWDEGRGQFRRVGERRFSRG